MALIALGIWWNSNTIAHNFIHRPFFKSQKVNHLFALFLSVLISFPQTVWKGRHLAHHANRKYKFRLTTVVGMESFMICLCWGAFAWQHDGFFLSVYLPGILLGWGLCYLQGEFEHLGGTTSHYGKIYNALFFNDGFHIEHHAQPNVHWTVLPHRRAAGQASAWPPVLRWIDWLKLDSLERLVIRWPLLQKFILKTHAQAFLKLAGKLPVIKEVTIVGGGLYPRTALVLQQLMPEAQITLLDRDASHLQIASRFVSRVKFVHATYQAEPDPTVDLLIIPLAYLGDRNRLYEQPPARAVLIHDWLWRPRGESVRISLVLLKRLNLIAR